MLEGKSNEPLIIGGIVDLLVIFVKLLQPLNADAPIKVTFSGIVNDVKPLLAANETKVLFTIKALLLLVEYLP